MSPNALTFSTRSQSKSRYDPQSVGQSLLVSSTHPGSKTRFLLLSGSCEFVDVGRPHWREDGSVVYNCCWPSPTQLCLQPVNSSSHFASWVLIQFLWWPLFCLLTRPHFAVMICWNIVATTLNMFRDELFALGAWTDWLGTCWLCLEGGTHFSHCGGADLCNWGRLRLLLLLCSTAMGWFAWKRTPFPF
jgi:hypothetical protein